MSHTLQEPFTAFDKLYICIREDKIPTHQRFLPLSSCKQICMQHTEYRVYLCALPPPAHTVHNVSSHLAQGVEHCLRAGYCYLELSMLNATPLELSMLGLESKSS